MAERFKQFRARIVEFWNKYTAKQKTLFFSVVAAVILTLVGLVILLNRTTYVRLGSFDDTAAASQAATMLDENGIKYRVTKDALSIDVDENQLSQARLLMGQNGISSSVNNTGYDWLFDNSMNTTDSERRLKAKINLQSEMEETIRSITGVTKCSVTINLPESKNTIYATDQSTSVSIMLTINSDFQDESAKTIAEYAKSCVGNSNTDDITIISNQGKLLFSGTSNSNMATDVILIEQQVEEYYNSKLWNLMVNSGVYDEVSVASNLKVTVSDEEIHDLKYYSNDEDDTGPKDSYYYYLAENTDGSGGIVGTDANGEEITDYDLLDNANGESTLNLIKESYKTSYTETVTRKPVGEVDMANSSMSLYLTRYVMYNEEEMEENGLLEEQTFAEFRAANSEETETINPPDLVTMLATATGMREANVYVVERIVPVFYPKEETPVPVQSIISIVLAVIIGALLLFVVFKGMRPEEVVEVEPELSVEALLATTKENQTLDDIEFSDKSAAKVQIEKFVDQNPEAVASLLRNWLNEDWE